MLKMNKKIFDTCISMIETVDVYIREISEENIDDYMDFFPFIDEDDIKLYKDIDKDMIMLYTTELFFKTEQSFDNKEELFYKAIICYILSLKIISDCAIHKPYTFILEMLREFDDLEKISYSLKTNKKDKQIVKKLIKMETDIIIKCNYFTNFIKL
jgi:hypothetical protein